MNSSVTGVVLAKQLSIGLTEWFLTRMFNVIFLTVSAEKIGLVCITGED